MTSAIDATKPITGSPTTQSVRDNFLLAKNEITDLQLVKALRLAHSAPTVEIFQQCAVNNTPQVIQFNQLTFKSPNDTTVFDFDDGLDEIIFTKSGWFSVSVSVHIARKINAGADATWSIHSQLKEPAGSFSDFPDSLRRFTLAAGTATASRFVTVAFVSRAPVAGSRLRWMQTCSDVTREVGVISLPPAAPLPGAPGIIFSIERLGDI